MTNPKTLALNFVCERYRNAVNLVPVENLASPVYGFDPEGWDLFAVVDNAVAGVGATDHVAVNRATREVRSLGKLGE